MKLNLLSLLSFFLAIVITVNGQQFLRGSDTTVQEQEQDHEKLFRVSMTAPKELTFKFVPDPVEELDLVGTVPEQTAMKMPSLEYNYKHCEDHIARFGNFEVTKPTTKIFAWLWPYYGCSAITIEQLNGSTWDTIRAPKRPCVINSDGWVAWWGSYDTYKVRVFEAETNFYNLKVCWD